MGARPGARGGEKEQLLENARVVHAEKGRHVKVFSPRVAQVRGVLLEGNTAAAAAAGAAGKAGAPFFLASAAADAAAAGAARGLGSQGGEPCSQAIKVQGRHGAALQQVLLCGLGEGHGRQRLAGERGRPGGLQARPHAGRPGVQRVEVHFIPGRIGHLCQHALH